MDPPRATVEPPAYTAEPWNRCGARSRVQGTPRVRLQAPRQELGPPGSGAHSDAQGRAPRSRGLNRKPRPPAPHGGWSGARLGGAARLGSGVTRRRRSERASPTKRAACPAAPPGPASTGTRAHQSGGGSGDHVTPGTNGKPVRSWVRPGAPPCCLGRPVGSRQGRRLRPIGSGDQWAAARELGPSPRGPARLTWVTDR